SALAAPAVAQQRTKLTAASRGYIPLHCASSRTGRNSREATAAQEALFAAPHVGAPGAGRRRVGRYPALVWISRIFEGSAAALGRPDQLSAAGGLARVLGGWRADRRILSAAARGGALRGHPAAGRPCVRGGRRQSLLRARRGGPGGHHAGG